MMFGDDAKNKAKGQQGKAAEKLVKDYLQALGEARQNFDWHRGYDARSAGGKFQRIAGDFSWYEPGRHGIIEVKEVAHKHHRLPYQNFDSSQVGKCRIRQLAGGTVEVLVYSSITKTWKCPPLSLFLTRPGAAFGSWDLEELPVFGTPEEALCWG
jgi:hypothetical protein